MTTTLISIGFSWACAKAHGSIANRRSVVSMRIKDGSAWLAYVAAGCQSGSLYIAKPWIVAALLQSGIPAAERIHCEHNDDPQEINEWQSESPAGWLRDRKVG